MLYQLEVIGFNIASCLIARDNGADRIELCHNPAEGGTTPSYGFIHAARKALTIALYPIIRPRGGDFLYNEDEYAIMKKDVALCKETGCDGVVIGMLDKDGHVDKKRCARLVEIAYPLGVSFHRAFDHTAEPFVALEDIIDIGCERILTSGLQPAAVDGIGVIRQLVNQANQRIIIMPGSGIRSSNLEMVAKQSTANEFHTSARTTIKSMMHHVNQHMQDELQHVQCDGEEVKNMAEILRKLNLRGLNLIQSSLD